MALLRGPEARGKKHLWKSSRRGRLRFDPREGAGAQQQEEDGEAASALGNSVSGYSAPDRKKIGITRKFMVSWNPCMSFRPDPIMSPARRRRQRSGP